MNWQQRECLRALETAAAKLEGFPGDYVIHEGMPPKAHLIRRDKSGILEFYTHKVRSTGNLHIRVRSQGVVPKGWAMHALALVQVGDCNFQFPEDRTTEDQAKVLATKWQGRKAK